LSDPRRSRLLALGISLFVSAALVVAAFNPAPHSGGDNAAYVTLAYSLAQHGTYTDLYDPEGLPHTKYPPVFPSLLAVLLLLGVRTWTALKAVTALSTIAAVGFTFLWAERRLGPWPALGVSVLLAICSAVVYYSHWVLSDPLFVAFTMAALWALESADSDDARWWWIVGGVAAAGLAYFTRSAGLPLLVALFAWLGLRKRWRVLGGSAVALGVPALLWSLHGRGEGVAQYGTEFLMVDPYQPSLGTVGIGGLVSRVFSNSWAYVSAHGPGGIIGGTGTEGSAGAVATFGILITAAALCGWFLSSRERVGVAELFLPLYAGLILLWPEVWSGDRFALPLYPLFFLFSALTLRTITSRLDGMGASALTVAVLSAVLLPAGSSWMTSVQQASACADATRSGGAWACYGTGIGDFATAARWMGEGLPEGSAVMTRKPRFFYVLSGIPSRVFPFDDDPAVLLTEADRLGARYVLIDRWDGLAGRYVGGALQRYPQAFCSVRVFGTPEAPSYLIGVLPPAQRGFGTPSAGDVQIGGCSNDFALAGAPGVGYSSSTSMRIPLLDGLDPLPDP
jgi:4-amino-4-deoxy-L-arabinose transferase-like glycosyltransferase